MEKYIELKDIRKKLDELLRYADTAQVAVKIYDCDETGEQTYDVEINCYINNHYEDGWVTDVAYEGELSQAKKRAAVVLRTVRKWFESSDIVEVQQGVEVYHA